MKFVIIGGDAAGMSAASRARRRNPGLEIIVLEQTRDVSYSACGMPYNIADPDVAMDHLVVRTADAFIAKNRIDLRVGHRVTALDRARRTVSGTTDTGQPFDCDYDVLLLATGASPIMPKVPGADLPCVMALKSLEQGRRIKDFLATRPVRHVVILGMGYIALEMCEAFVARGASVSLIKPGPVFMPWLVPELSGVIRKELTDKGVALYPGHEIRSMEACGDGARIRCDELTLDADLVLAATGVIPCSGLAHDAGLDLGPDRAISVDACLKTTDDQIYAAGDCADALHLVTGRRCWIPLALLANRSGWAVADTVCGTPTRVEGIVGTAVFKVFSLEVARTGLTLSEARDAGFDASQVHITTSSRAHGQPLATDIHVNLVGDSGTGRLLGVQMVGHEGVAHRINAAAVALHTAMTVAAFSQMDLAYAPPFGPVWDPLLTAANQWVKQRERDRNKA